MILITTSRRPTKRVRSFCKDLALVIPNSTKVNRGKKSLHDVLIEAVQRRHPYFLIVETWKGNPGNMLFYSTSNLQLEEPIAVFRVKGVKLQREIQRRTKWKNVGSIAVIKNPTNPELSEFFVRVFGGKLREKTGQVKEDVTLEIKGNDENILKFKDGETGMEVGPRVRFKVVKLGLP